MKEGDLIFIHNDKLKCMHSSVLYCYDIGYKSGYQGNKHKVVLVDNKHNPHIISGENLKSAIYNANIFLNERKDMPCLYQSR